MALDAQTRSALARVSTATLTTCLFKRGLRNTFLQDVRPVAAGLPRMVGEAFTLRLIPAREDLDSMEAYADPQHPQRRAIETCPPGSVLVIDSRGEARAASAGDILIARLKARGVAGIVTDGGYRDLAGILRLGFPAYFRRPSAPPGAVFLHAADVQLPIGCGGVAVYPGDVMVGDEDGVVCVPAHLVAEIAAEAVAMTEYEDFVLERVEAGRALAGLYPATAASRAEFAAWQRAKGTSSAG